LGFIIIIFLKRIIIIFLNRNVSLSLFFNRVIIKINLLLLGLEYKNVPQSFIF